MAESNSKLITAGFFIVLFAFILQVTSIATDYWVVRKEGREIRWNAGIWTYPLKRAFEPRGVNPVAIPVLCLTSAFFLLITLVLNAVYVFKKAYAVLPVMMGLTFVSGFVSFLVIVIWAPPHIAVGLNLFWAYALFVISSVAAFVAFGIYVAKFVHDRRPSGEDLDAKYHMPPGLYRDVHGNNQYYTSSYDAEEVDPL